MTISKTEEQSMNMVRILGVAALAVTPAVAQQAYTPGPTNVAFPANYASAFIRYATVDKPDRKIIRYLYVNPEAFAAARKGEPLPYGAVIVMEDHAARLGPDGAPLVDQQGRFIANPAVTGVFVQEKRKGWGEGYPANIRNGEWEYARFNPDGSRHPGAVENCFTCHLNTRKEQDFAFNLWDYVQTRK
jgi:Cytochrome P460